MLLNQKLQIIPHKSTHVEDSVQEQSCNINGAQRRIQYSVDVNDSIYSNPYKSIHVKNKSGELLLCQNCL